MIMGQACGTAACLAIDAAWRFKRSPIQSCASGCWRTSS